IAETPLSAYHAGGHNFLFIHGNDTTMMNVIGGQGKEGKGGTSKTEVVKRSLSALFTDTTTVSAKVTAGGQMLGLGLMTYGGTSSTSPYLWPLSNSPYTRYGVGGKPDELMGPQLNSSNSSCYGNNNFFYRNVDPISHPYCLPTTIPHPTGYLQGDGSCSAQAVTGTRCYIIKDNNNNDKVMAATPAMGKLQVAIKANPTPSNKEGSDAAKRAEEFTKAIGDAGYIDGNPVEGALLTACDYFNTKWLGDSGGARSACFRGYPSGLKESLVDPKNQFNEQSQGDTGQIPNMPVSCDASIIFITDNLEFSKANSLQFMTADGIPYSVQDFATVEKNPGVTSGPDKDLLIYNTSFNGGPTDPVMVALYNLNAGNKNGGNIATFMVGLGMNNNTSLNKLVNQGASTKQGLTAYYPTDTDSTKAGLDNIFSYKLFTPMSTAGSAGSSTTTNSTSFKTSDIIFQGQFNYSAGWFGDLKAFNKITNLSFGSQIWSASDKLKEDIGTAVFGVDTYNVTKAATRPIYTYNPTSLTGVSFSCDSLSSNQWNAIECGTRKGGGSSSDLLDWLRGNVSKEFATFRYRAGKILGDIVNSNPVYVGGEDFADDVLPEGVPSATNPYQTFLNIKATRKPVIYVGANDGMLHGFSVGSLDKSYSDGGTEIFAYIPNALIGPSLKKYAALPAGGNYFPHVYAVDGSPVVGDACLPDGPNCKQWKTVLLGTTGAGGKAVFALDITCPATTGKDTPCASGFSASNVMWEISDADASACTPVCGDTTTGTETSIHGDLGYTVPQPAIVRLNNGQWAAIVANGYSSANGHAVLFIFNLADGSLIRKLDTGTGGNTVVAKNGLSAPKAVDIDENRTVDYVYAGDLEGNVWKFDLTASSKSDWKAPKEPVFVACTTNDTTSCDPKNRQPITSIANAGLASGIAPNGGVIVYVGTGKYFELGDNLVPDSPQTQSFYAFWNNPTVTGTTLGRGDLVAQEILTQTSNFRTSTSKEVDYAKKKGWFIDLLNPNSNSSLGERVVEDSIVKSERVLFETLIPNNASSCTPGGTSAAFEVNALTGAPIPGGAWAGEVKSASAFMSTGGILSSPTIIKNSDGSEIRIYSGSSGSSGPTVKSGNYTLGTQRGRTSWSQIQ
ncbi:partial Type IV pilus biogenesis factor PilY1, partial [Methylococcales bacterium]